MPLQSGTRLGVYEVLSPLGAGGMGEVYRARDTKIGRSVAIKILPDSFVDDPERVSRFQREAQILGALNHPHIAAIYGLDDAGGTQFLVMELVEGQTLDRRLADARTHLAIDEALAIARQLADGLQAAHEKGIIHRDLKPANIAITADGQVKILDFGLARFDASDGGGSTGASQSPTLTFAHTRAGVILGTAAYMSPEQARGRVADKRSDVWAFGCVLYEMLAGKRAFSGEDITDVIASVVRDEPDWEALPAHLPSPIRTLVQRCLKKDRQQRIADIGVAQFLLNEPAADAGRTVGGTSIAISAAERRRWQIVAAVLALTAAGALAAAAYFYTRTTSAVVTRFFVTPPARATFVTAGRPGTTPLISPDGRRLAFTARDETGRVVIWQRPLDALTAQPIAGTEDAEFPFWSPDSRSLGYFAKGKLLRIDAAGGPPQTICDAEGARGGAWSRDAVIVFGGAGATAGLNRVSAAGGTPVALTKVDGGDHRFPSFLPDGRHVLFYGNAPGAPADKNGIYLATLGSGDIKRIGTSTSAAVYAPSGFLLFVRQTTLLAQPFDLQRLELTGEPTPIAQDVESGVFGGVLGFSIADSGVLAYGVGTGRDVDPVLAWLDRKGQYGPPVTAPGAYAGFDLSPDEKVIALHRHDQGTGGDVWLLHLERGTMSRFTFDAAQDNSAPVWSPDGVRIAFASLRRSRWGLFVKAASGTAAEELLIEPGGVAAPKQWSPDGRFLVYTTADSTNADVWMVPIAGERKPVPLLTTRFQERNPQISPDGKWLAYSSDEGGTPEVYVRPFPNGDGKWQISTDGGVDPRWRADGGELFYTDRPQLGSILAVDVNAGSSFSYGTPRKLFDTRALALAHPGPVAARYVVSHDGQRFLFPTISRFSQSSTDPNSSPIAVVVNWAAALQK